MLLSRLFWRIFLTYAAITLIAVMLMVHVVMRSHELTLLQQIETNLNHLCISLNQGAYDFVAEPQKSNTFSSPLPKPIEMDHWITIYNMDGRAVYDSRDKTFTPSNPSATNKNLLAISSWETAKSDGSSFFYTGELSQPKSIAVHLHRIGPTIKPIAMLMVATDLSTIGSSLRNTRTMTLTIAGSMVLLMTGIGYLVVSRIIKPLDDLTQAAQSIVAGDLLQKLDIPNKDELGTLARAFNSMSEELSSRIQELQKQGKKLQENSERLATILGGMVEGVIAVDADQRLLFSNKAAYNLIEFEGLRVVGRPFWEAIRNTNIQQIVQNILYKEDQLKTELYLPRSNATIIVTASRLPGNPCPGMVMVMHDITEIRRLENMRKEFVSNVHHELKTPLASIQAYTETLIDGAIDDPDVNRHFLTRINQSVDRLNDLIMDLLKLARIESVEDAFDNLEFPMSDTIYDVIDAHRFAAETRKITLVTQPADEDLFIFADPRGFSTVLDNLLSNAIKYTHDNTEVTIRWYHKADMAVLEVEDHGDGIPFEHQARIFERFYRVDSARARDVGGTGLGLAIVKHIVQIFKGSIELKSQTGQGSIFIVKIPLARISQFA